MRFAYDFLHKKRKEKSPISRRIQTKVRSRRGRLKIDLAREVIEENEFTLQIESEVQDYTEYRTGGDPKTEE